MFKVSEYLYKQSPTYTRNTLKVMESLTGGIQTRTYVSHNLSYLIKNYMKNN